MRLEHSLDRDFEAVYKNIGEEFLKIEAIDADSMNVGDRRSKYHQNKKIAGEENANVGNNKNPNNREGVLYEPLRKIDSYNVLYEKIKDKYGLEVGNEAIKEMLSGSLLMNDSDGSDQRYCIAMSAHSLVNKGRDYVTDVPNTNPKHFRSYLHTCVEQIMQMSMEFKGATVIYDILIFLAGFTKPVRDYKHKSFDELDYEMYIKFAISELINPYKDEDKWEAELREKTNTTSELIDYTFDYWIRNELQGVVLILNNKYRNASQSPFVNFSLFSPRVLDGQFDYFRYPNGEKIQNYIREITRIQEIFAEFFSQGIQGRVRDIDGNLTDKKLTKLVPFPVVTLSKPNDDIGSEHLLGEDNRFIDKIERLFSKYHNTNIYKGVKLALCCRLLTESHEKVNHTTEMSSLGVVTNATSYDAVGSLRVVALGLPSIALQLSENDRNIENYLKVLDVKLDLVVKILNSQRSLIEDRTNENFFDFTEKQGVKNDKLASTIGGLGLYEAVKLLTGSEWGETYTQYELDIANEILKAVDAKCAQASKATGKIFNMELSIPGESSAKRLQKRDVLNFGNEVNYKELSNQFLPATIDTTINEKLKVENELCKYVPSTTIAHLNIDVELSEEQTVQLHKKISEAYPNLSHYAFNPITYLCEDGHLNTTSTDDGLCIECGGKIVDRSTRSIGYIRSIDYEFGKNRKDEQSRRTYYKLK